MQIFEPCTLIRHLQYVSEYSALRIYHLLVLVDVLAHQCSNTIQHASTHHSVPSTNPQFPGSVRAAACDHCTFFKGIVCPCHAQRHFGDDTLTMRYNNMSQGLRSLESNALQEAAIENRDYARYMKSKRAKINANVSASPKKLMRLKSPTISSLSRAIHWYSGSNTT